MTYVSCWLDEVFEDDIIEDVERQLNSVLDHYLVVRVVDGVRRVEVGLDEIDVIERRSQVDLVVSEYCYIIKSAIEEYKKERNGKW